MMNENAYAGHSIQVRQAPGIQRPGLPDQDAIRCN